MTIVHVDGIAFSEVPRGGISRMWQNVLNRLPRHGCHVRLYLPLDVDPSIQFSSEIELVRYPKKRTFRPGRLFNPILNRSYLHSLNRMWSNAKSGVFQSTHFTTYSSLKIPQVVTVHDLFHEILPDCFPAHQLGPFCVRRRESIDAADAIVAVSGSTLSDVDRVYGLRGRLAGVINNAVDPVFLNDTPSSDFLVPEPFLQSLRPYLLYVGTRYPYKNFNGLLAAFSAWEKRKEFNLVAVGPAPDHHECAALRGFGIRDKVHFVGHLRDDELRVAYGSASMFVVPSLSEGFGIPIWEAMACQTPVVASNAGAMPEVGQDIAVYFEHGAPHEMTRAFDLALEAASDKDRMRRGKELALSFSWDNAAAAYADLYRSVTVSGK
jgi:glycosyltransferase involved in cell wall biosynthesis